MKAEFRRADEKYIVAEVQNGPRYNVIRVYGLPDEFCGCPGVCITGDIQDEMLTPEQAEKLAAGLIAAAKAARTMVQPLPDNVVKLR
jgi:hypothetical protein